MFFAVVLWMTLTPWVHGYQNGTGPGRDDFKILSNEHFTIYICTNKYFFQMAVVTHIMSLQLAELAISGLFMGMPKCLTRPTKGWMT